MQFSQLLDRFMNSRGSTIWLSEQSISAAALPVLPLQLPSRGHEPLLTLIPLHINVDCLQDTVHRCQS